MRRAIGVSRSLSRWRVACQASRPRAFCSASGPADDDSKHPSTPASPSDATSAKEPFVGKKVWQKVDKNVIFPWRHETEPLERLVDPNVKGGVLGPGMWPMPWWLKHLFMQTAGVHLNVPFHKVLTTSEWRQELADASGFAFSQAVAGVLANRYKVPFQEIVSDDGAIEFDKVTEIHDESEEGDKDSEADPADKKDPKKTAEDEDDDIVPEVEYMMGEKLRKLYEVSHEFGKDQLRIILRTEPVECELVSLLFIPYLTRQAVRDAPSLKHSFKNMFREVEKKRIDPETGQQINFVQLVREAFKTFEAYVNSRAQYNRDDGSVAMESKVIAQVLITCDEVFSVTDVVTGMILQGNGEKQRVTHLVRLEVPVKETIPPDGGKQLFEVGSWQIVDWDDLEDGDIWFI